MNLFKIKVFKVFLKHILLLLTIVLIGLKPAIGQGTVFSVVGNNSSPIGATADQNPFQNYYTQSKGQYLYTAAQLNAAGIFGPTQIHSIGFNVTSLATAGITCSGGNITSNTQMLNYSVRIKTTSTTVLTTTFETAGFTTVRASSTYNVASGWNTFTLSTPIAWDGVSNILIDVCHDNSNNVTTTTCYGSNGAGTVAASSTATTLSCMRRQDSEGDICATTSTATTSLIRPDIRFQYTPPPMRFVSSNVVQSLTTPVIPGTINNQIIRVDVVTTGSGNPLNLTELNFNTNGTNNLGNVTNAKVFYTGNSASFAATNQFGSTVSNPGATFNLAGSRTLTTGTNYFWLVYDIIGSAPSNDTVDAACVQLTYDSLTTLRSVVPTVTSPSGLVWLFAS
jgi:hypothetical protein